MNALELAIKEAFEASGNNQKANKAYLEFIKANFIIPVDKKTSLEQPEVLFLIEDEHIFLPVFTRREYLDVWAKEIKDEIQVLILSGVNLLKGIGDQVAVCLNLGNDNYKEFNSAEILRMKNMVLKIFK